MVSVFSADILPTEGHAPLQNEFLDRCATFLLEVIRIIRFTKVKNNLFSIKTILYFIEICEDSCLRKIHVHVWSFWM